MTTGCGITPVIFQIGEHLDVPWGWRCGAALWLSSLSHPLDLVSGTSLSFPTAWTGGDKAKVLALGCRHKGGTLLSALKLSPARFTPDDSITCRADNTGLLGLHFAIHLLSDKGLERDMYSCALGHCWQCLLPDQRWMFWNRRSRCWLQTQRAGERRAGKRSKMKTDETLLPSVNTPCHWPPGGRWTA